MDQIRYNLYLDTFNGEINYLLHVFLFMNLSLVKLHVHIIHARNDINNNSDESNMFLK